MSTTADFEKFFTPKQKSQLIAEGYKTMYAIIINFPFRYQIVNPVGHDPLQDRSVYLISGYITQVTRRPGFFIFSIQSEQLGQVFECYYFVTARFVHSTFVVGSLVQAEIVKNKKYIVIKKIALQKNPSQKSNLLPTLGLRENSEYIVPIYNKTGNLKTTDWHRIHSRIHHYSYILDLSQLIPNNIIFPMKIDLQNIHKPTDLTNVTEIMRQYNALRIFLKLAHNQFSNQQTAKKLAKASTPNSRFLSNLSQQLPYELSISQKTIIWEVINGFGSAQK